jgi:hypothetical protein
MLAIHSRLKGLGAEALERLGMGLFWFIVAFVWLLAGSIIGIPYILLSGGELASFPIPSLLAPIVVFMLFISYTMESKEIAREGKRGIPWFTVTIILWLTLPIWLNWASVGLKKLGYTSHGDWTFNFRYPSIFVVFLAAILLLVLIAAGNNAIQGIRKKIRR